MQWEGRSHPAPLYPIFSSSLPCQQIPFRKRRSDNDEIAHKAPHIRYLAEQDGSEDRRVDDLRIIKYRNVPRGRVLVSSRDCQLCAGGGGARKHQEEELLQGHGAIIEQQVGQKDYC